MISNRWLVSVCVFLMFGLTVSSLMAGDLIRKPSVIEDERGRSIEVIQVLSPNSDGSFTVIKVEPEKEVVAFFERACKDELGPDAKYIPLTDETRISEAAQYTYSCQLEYQVGPE